MPVTANMPEFAPYFPFCKPGRWRFAGKKLARAARCGKMECMVLNQRYEIGEPIGAGGEAHVHRARDVVTGVEVALRLSPTSGTGDVPSPLHQTPEQHPGWVRLLDRGVDEAHGAYAVFELLHGETLGAMVARGPIPANAWQRFTRQSLETVGALHRAGWVHGDLNADNFLLHDGTTWKLLDLPFHQSAPAEKRSPLFGSIQTMAPEQFAGKGPDVRSDLYALGCLYYAAASGVYPHAGGSEAEIAIGRLRFPPAPLQGLAASLKPDKAAWVMRLLEINPMNRPADFAAARQLLKRTDDSRPSPGQSPVD
jgi:serine/threonine protein kinase